MLRFAGHDKIKYLIPAIRPAFGQLDLPSRLYQDCLGLGSTMRGFCLLLACVTLSGVTAGGAAPKVDLTPVTSSPLPSMQKYNGYVGKDYWTTLEVQQCAGPSSLHCLQFLKPGTHLKVDGLVPNHSEVAGTSIDDPYFHIVMDDGRSGFISAVIFSSATTTLDPVAALAECKKKGGPKLGMTAVQVKASCWGAPKYVNAKVRKTGKYEQYVYGDGKFVQIRDGIVTSVSVKGRGHIPDELKR
jgi:hypothetical protein